MKNFLLSVCVLLMLGGVVQTENVPFIELKGHISVVVSAAFSPDGKKIVTANEDKAACIWDMSQHTSGGLTPPVILSPLPLGAKITEGGEEPAKEVNNPHPSPLPEGERTKETGSVSPPLVSSPLDLPPVQKEEDEYAAERARIIAEEKAKELALIEEERKIVPLVDEPKKLIPLDPQDRIWITPDRKSVILLGRVTLREGFLELLACRIRTKEHESILSVRVKPFLVHAALLATNARQGKPMQMSPAFIPASGEKIDITLHWKDESGKQHEARAQDWVWDMSVSKEDAKKPMTTHWVFSGSKEYQDDEGKKRYLADESGELFGLSNFFCSVLDVPIQSSADNTKLQFGCFTERIPPLGTPVTIVLTAGK